MFLCFPRFWVSSLCRPTSLLRLVWSALFCCARDFTRLASWFIVTSLVLIALVGLSPLGNALILPLEQRFPPWDDKRGPSRRDCYPRRFDLARCVGCARCRRARRSSRTPHGSAPNWRAATRTPGSCSRAAVVPLIFDRATEATFAARQLEDLGIILDYCVSAKANVS